MSESETNKSGLPELSPQFTLGLWFMGIGLVVSVFTALLGMEVGWGMQGKFQALIQAIAAAFALYGLRTYRRKLYGLLEVAFAVLLLIFAISNRAGVVALDKENMGYLAQIAAGIYVLIRGLDNMVLEIRPAK
ncbi:hypothetical protein [Mesorhizobium sp. LSHC412B00]|uniref:hypothetical protein n=1 Tax=Mesorhizobium sp. LSHC412B00 TaxID=1287285 RepID=UPI0003CE591D|nr:hypothetical protein [Mesorhizobium sp. LSHC412B00]ESX91377.1 hypothetical protein X756_04435 [Mesorhizobium sp. LSHC412B00]